MTCVAALQDHITRHRAYCPCHTHHPTDACRHVPPLKQAKSSRPRTLFFAKVVFRPTRFHSSWSLDKTPPIYGVCVRSHWLRAVLQGRAITALRYPSIRDKPLLATGNYFVGIAWSYGSHVRGFPPCTLSRYWLNCNRNSSFV